MFYKRQFSTYNYCIFNGATSVGAMYVWNESIGNRGSDEVASCLLLYVEQNYNQLENGQQRTLVFWSDRCRGQTNNFMMICLFQLLIARRIFSRIEQKFLVTGHSYLPCDQLFGLIEKEKKKSIVIVPTQWIDVLRSTKIPGSTPFIVREMNQNDLISLEPLLALIPRPNTLQISSYSWYILDAATPHLILCKPNFNPGSLGTWEILRQGGRGRIVNRPVWTSNAIQNLELNRKYVAPLPITRAKYDDLMSMMELVAPEFREFYQNLIFH